MSGEARAVMDKSLCEADWQRVVEECAAWHGWISYHDRDSRKNNPGFPDLVLVHPSRGEIIFVEMKTERGKLRPEQIIWQDALIGAGARYFLWRPSMFAEVEATLRGVGWERRKGE